MSGRVWRPTRLIKEPSLLWWFFDILRVKKFMNKVYLTKLQDVLRRARLPSEARFIEYKTCFGAVAGYVRGYIFVSCGRFGVALKLPPETLERLFKEGNAKHLKYFPNGHIKKEYAVLPRRIVKNRRALNRLLNTSIDYVI